MTTTFEHLPPACATRRTTETPEQEFRRRFHEAVADGLEGDEREAALLLAALLNETQPLVGPPVRNWSYLTAVLRVDPGHRAEVDFNPHWQSWQVRGWRPSLKAGDGLWTGSATTGDQLRQCIACAVAWAKDEMNTFADLERELEESAAGDRFE